MTEDDCDDLFAVLADSSIMQHYPYTFDEGRVKNWINRNQRRYRVFGFGLWAVIEKETGKMIGDCGLTMQNVNGFILPEIGYHIRKDRQRNGFASEGALATMKWLFDNTPFQEVFSYMHKSNFPSVGVALKNGMRLLYEYEDEREGTVSVYGITKEEFFAR